MLVIKFNFKCYIRLIIHKYIVNYDFEHKQ